MLDAADVDVLTSNTLVSKATSDLADEVATLAILQASLVIAEGEHAVQVYLAAQAAAAALVQSNIVADWSEVCGDPLVPESCSDALSQLELLYDTAA